MPNTFENLRLYHAAKTSETNLHLKASDVSPGAVWETCLRKIHFYNSAEEKKLLEAILPEMPSSPPEKSPRFYEGDMALEFLLSLLCGLDSKVVGETEIFGQFKLFAQSPEAQKISFFRDSRAVQFLYQEVKAIRDIHLKGLGVHSYGSLIRKMSKDLPSVSIIGYGHLAQEVIPWFKNKRIDIHVRNPERYTNEGTLRFHDLYDSTQTSLAELVVVAAPISSEELKLLFASRGQKISQIIDCRSLDSKQTSLVSDKYNVVELKDLFDLLKGQQQKIQEALPRIRNEISKCVKAYSLRSHHRPMGWDDLC